MNLTLNENYFHPLNFPHFLASIYSKGNSYWNRQESEERIS